MNPLVKLSRAGAVRRFGKFVEIRTRALLDRALDVFVPEVESGSLADLRDVQSLLFVRPNFRIGNTVLATGMMNAVRTRFPQARIDYLGADTTASLLDGLPIHRCYCMSRRFIFTPWRFIALFLRLRREKFDLAVVGDSGSYSGALYAFLSGARQRLGFSGRADRFLTVRLDRVQLNNAYDFPAAVAQVLGVTPPTAPTYQVSAEEERAALAMLRAMGLGQRLAGGFLALFVGGHRDKRWEAERWVELMLRLHAGGVRLVILIGPEELALGKRLQACDPALCVVPPQPLRLFAALLAHAGVLVTPDSGPMHLAAALGVPTLVVLRQERSRYYVPCRTDDRVLFQPDTETVLSTLRAHPRWQDMQGRATISPTGAGN